MASREHQQITQYAIQLQQACVCITEKITSPLAFRAITVSPVTSSEDFYSKASAEQYFFHPWCQSDSLIFSVCEELARLNQLADSQEPMTDDETVCGLKSDQDKFGRTSKEIRW